MQKRCGLQVKATESLFAVNAPVLKTSGQNSNSLKKKNFFFKALWCWAELSSPYKTRGLKGGNRWQVKGYCHFKKPAD